MLFLVVIGSACVPSAEVQDPGPLDVANFPPGADVIVAYSDGPQVVSCTLGLPACGQPAPSCGPTQVLGIPDGQSFNLPQNGVLEVAFRCGVILERGGSAGSVDFQIFGNLGDGTRVQVAADDREFATLRFAGGIDPGGRLEDADMTEARYVRITAGFGGAMIDAVDSVR